MASPEEHFQNVLERLKQHLFWLRMENEDHAAIWSIEFYLQSLQEGAQDARARKDRIFKEAAWSLDSKGLDKFWNYAQELVSQWMEEEYASQTGDSSIDKKTSA